MKKQIIELLRELNGLTHDLVRIISYPDGKYCLVKRLTYYNFNSEKQLIQGLKDKIKELKNK